VSHEGYCTDIWFHEATKFIVENKDRPFFAYIATNAPHGPFLVSEKYRRPYEGNPDIPDPGFCGMVTNIDENFGRLDATLKELGIDGNTILIFMTDNGSDGGLMVDERSFVTKGHSAGMRGKKGHYYDGGHRVPFFFRWPDGRVGGGKDVDEMAFHVDLLPTFIDLCGLKAPNGVKFDGTSLAGPLRGRRTGLPDRTQFLQYRQDTVPPEKWTNAVLTKQWRLVNGTELYDIKAEPGQKTDVADKFPAIVARLREAHEKLWDEVSPSLDQYSPISLGNDAENPTRLDAMDVMGDMAFSQNTIVLARKSTGRWTVDVERAGTYTFSLRRWPKELGLPIAAAVSPKDARSHTHADETGACTTIHPTRARIKLFDQELSTPVAPDATEVTFTLTVTKPGVTQLDAWFVGADGEERGAYYVYVERV
jgi:hypothetical protein